MTGGRERPRRARRALRAGIRRGGWPLLCGLAGALVLAAAVLASIVFPYDAAADTDLGRRFASPGTDGSAWAHPLGRDLYGRDLARVMMEGTRAFCGPGLLAVAVAVPLAMLAALARPLPGDALPGERTAVLALGAVPTLVWLLLASVAGGQRPAWVAVALGLTHAPDLAAELRGRFGQLEARGLMEGARAHQLPPRRVRWVHLARLEGLPPLLRHSARLFAAMLLAEASLSYLGDFGVPEPIPSWGRLLRDLSPLLFRAEPGAALWVALVPLTALVLTSLLVLSLGEGLARAFDYTSTCDISVGSADRMWDASSGQHPGAALEAGGLHAGASAASALEIGRPGTNAASALEIGRPGTSAASAPEIGRPGGKGGQSDDA
jgi:peptide/nickel transport system permease protein